MRLGRKEAINTTSGCGFSQLWFLLAVTDGPQAFPLCVVVWWHGDPSAAMRVIPTRPHPSACGSFLKALHLDSLCEMGMSVLPPSSEGLNEIRTQGYL